MAELRVVWQDKTYTLDLGSITSREYKTIKSYTGLRIGQFERALYNIRVDGLDPEVLDALMWMFKKRAGEDAMIGEDDSYRPMDFISNLTFVADDDEEAAEVPKVSDGTPTSTSPNEPDSTPTGTTGTSGS